jgi:hypothetical protein
MQVRLEEVTQKVQNRFFSDLEPKIYLVFIYLLAL